MHKPGQYREIRNEGIKKKKLRKDWILLCLGSGKRTRSLLADDFVLAGSRGDGRSTILAKKQVVQKGINYLSSLTK